MAIVFDKVPLEIRDMIYEFHPVKCYTGVEFRAIQRGQYSTYDRPVPKIDLNPAILCTCKQAYAEGLPMLYEQNVFTYVSYTKLYRATMATDDPLKDKTRSIKHVGDRAAFDISN